MKVVDEAAEEAAEERESWFQDPKYNRLKDDRCSEGPGSSCV